MSYNPYASPQALPPGQNPQVPQGGAPQPWEIGEVMSAAWNLYKIHWVTFTFGFFIVSLIGGVPGQIPGILVQAGALTPNTNEYYAVAFPLTVVGWIISTYFGAGFTFTLLRAIRSGDATIGDFFKGGSRFLPYLGMEILRMLGMLLGSIAFIIPGIIFMLGVSLSSFYVVEQNMGPVASLSASWEATKGHKGQLFLLVIVQIMLAFAGVAACCVGYFVALPLIAMMNALVYTRLSGTAMPPGGGYGQSGGYPPPPAYGAPPGGYGPPPGYGGPPPPAGGFGG